MKKFFVKAGATSFGVSGNFCKIAEEICDVPKDLFKFSGVVDDVAVDLVATSFESFREIRREECGSYVFFSERPLFKIKKSRSQKRM